jgi:hypothetical protein
MIQMLVVLVKKNLKLYYKILYEFLVILLFVSVFINTSFLVLKKKQFEKVQAAELKLLNVKNN